MDYIITTNKPGEPLDILVTSTVYNKSNAQLNALIVESAPGTIIHTAGYAAMKEKGIDGSWTAL